MSGAAMMNHPIVAPMSRQMTPAISVTASRGRTSATGLRARNTIRQRRTASDAGSSAGLGTSVIGIDRSRACHPSRMLLDIGSVLGGVGLAVVAFVVVILVCVVILRLLAVILPSYEDRDARAASNDPVAEEAAAAASEAHLEGAGEDTQD